MWCFLCGRFKFGRLLCYLICSVVSCYAHASWDPHLYACLSVLVKNVCCSFHNFCDIRWLDPGLSLDLLSANSTILACIQFLSGVAC